jgi:hypothetical protein
VHQTWGYVDIVVKRENVSILTNRESSTVADHRIHNLRALDSQYIEGCIVQTQRHCVALAIEEHVQPDSQYQILVKSVWDTLHGENLILQTMPASSVMLSLTESVAAMKCNHFLEDEFAELDKILFFFLHQYVRIKNMWQHMKEEHVT